jgi:hypothetical protein
MADILLKRRLIDYIGLNSDSIPERYLYLFKDLNPVLALLQGMGPDGAQLLQTDANGNLQIVFPAAGIDTDTNIDEWGGVAVAVAATGADALGNFIAPKIYAQGLLLNNATYDRARSASAANLALLSGTGIALTTGPGVTAINHNPAAGAQATIGRIAQGGVIRNVCKAVGFGFSSQAVLGGVSTVTFNLRDGGTGAGTILYSWTYDLPAAIIAPFGEMFTLPDVFGTANTAMTLESSAAVAGLRVYVNLSTYNAV